MKRKGETFTEFLASLAIFGLTAASICDFMAIQTQNIARIRDFDNMMFLAQQVCSYSISRDIDPSDPKRIVWEHNILHNVNHDIEAGKEVRTYDYSNKDTGQDPEFTIEREDEDSPITDIQHNIVSFDWYKENHTLTVKKSNGLSLSFTLRP